MQLLTGGAIDNKYARFFCSTKVYFPTKVILGDKNNYILSYLLTDYDGAALINTKWVCLVIRFQKKNVQNNNRYKTTDENYTKFIFRPIGLHQVNK